MSPQKRYSACTFKFSVRTNVLLTSVHVSLPYNPSIDEGKSPPQVFECRAIWDTGATNSVITKNLVQKLGLVPTGKEKVINTSIVDLKNSYVINVLLPNKVIMSYLKVTECENVLGDGNADMLIGMDIIASGDFSISYEDSKTVMSFIMPTMKTTDYVPIAISENQKQEMLEKFEHQKQLRTKHQLPRKELRSKHKKEKYNKKKGHLRH